MQNRFLSAVLILGLMTPDAAVWAQTRARTSNVKKPAAKAASSKKKTTKKRKPVSTARVRRVKRAFVASAELKSMARQLVENRTPAAYEGVEAYARKHAGTDEGALAWLAVGYAHTLDREWEKALPPLKKAAAHAGELGDYVAYFTAMSQGGLGQGEAVLETLKDFEKNWGESIFARDVVAIYGNGLTAAGRPQEAVKYLETYRSPTRADVELALGRAYVKAGNQQKGIEVLRRLYFTMPLSAEAAAAGADLDSMAATMQLPQPNYNDRRIRAGLLANGNRWTDAAREYRALLNDAPPEDRAVMQVQLGVALRRSGNGREGRQILESTDAAADVAANGQRLYNLGEIARSDEDEGRMLANLQTMRQQTPNSAWFAQALMTVGNYYLLKRDYDKAIDQYREIHVRFPREPRAGYAHWKAAWLSFRQGRKEEAKKEFIVQIQEYPNSQEAPAALYWRARIAEEENDLTTARAWYSKAADRYRNYYYGYLARERMAKLNVTGAAPSDPVLATIPPVKPFTPESQVTDVPDTDLRVEKSKLLENGGLADFAVKELQAAAGGSGANWATLEIARIYRDNGQPHRTLQMLKRAVPSYFAVEISALPRPYWEGLFPRPYWGDLKRYSSANGLDPNLVASLIRQESEFNPAAISHANAYGLMQLLPTVGKGEARELKVRGFNTGMLLSAPTNIQLGTRYFKEMVEKYNGQVEYALAAYNAGSNRVDDWLGQGPYRDVAEFVESIPFTETREYVQAITRNAQIYKKIYAEQ
jgi:soluble lytic murein transglycosylase